MILGLVRISRIFGAPDTAAAAAADAAAAAAASFLLASSHLVLYAT